MPFARERLKRALANRVRLRRVRLLPPALPPSYMMYYADLRKYLGRVQTAILSALDLRLDAAPTDPLEQIRIRFEGDDEPRQIARRVAVETERANRNAMNAQFRTIAKIDVFENNPALHAQMQTAIYRNVRLIKSIPEELLDDVAEIIEIAGREGTRAESITGLIQHMFDVSERRARLIARTEIARYNSELTEARQRSVGVKTYRWSTSRDERVRGGPLAKKGTEDHYHLEGKTCSWDDPPIVDPVKGIRSHPGRRPNCRCTSSALVSDVLDALGL